MEKTIPQGSIGFSIFVLSVLISLIYISCTRAVKKEAPEIDKGVKDEIVKDYINEGFTSTDTFRIVIIQPRECDDERERIEKSARQRAFVSLQKYLSSINKTVNNNTRAKLLNLTKQNGSLKILEEKCDQRKIVYIFEIKRANLKHYIDTISERR
jgi:hypothetical protein